MRINSSPETEFPNLTWFVPQARKPASLDAGAGKTNPTVHQLIDHPMVYTATDGKIRKMGEIVYVSSREEIERRDVSRFLLNFGPHLAKQKLRQLRGRIIVTVDGFDGTQEALFEIPKVRDFYRLAHKRWPCWLYAACLASPCLRVIAAAVLPNVSIIRSGHECLIRVPEPDLMKFFLESIPTCGLMFFRAGISRKCGVQYLGYVASHLGISLQ